MNEEYQKFEINDNGKYASLNLILQSGYWTAIVIYMKEEDKSNVPSVHYVVDETKDGAYNRALSWYINNINNNAEIEPLN